MSLVSVGLVRPTLIAQIVHKTLVGGSGGADCWLYYFKPADPARLDYDVAFTGNFKANIATFNGVIGLDSNLSGLALTNSPEEARDDPSLLVWNKADVAVTAMAGICDGTFDGVVANYAKDDVWFNVNMGAPVVYDYYVPTRANIPNLIYSNSFRLEFEVATNTDITTEQWIYSDWDGSQNSVAVRIKGGNVECFTFGVRGQNIFTIPVAANSVNGIVLEFSLSTTTLGVNGATVSKASKGQVLDADNTIYVGQKDGSSLPLDGFVRVIKYVDYTNTSNSRLYDFNKAESVLVDSLSGNDGVVTGGSLETYIVNGSQLDGVNNANTYTILIPEEMTSAILLLGQSNTVSRAASVPGVDDVYTNVTGRVNQYGALTKTFKNATNPLEHHDATGTSAGFWLEMSNNTTGNQLLIPTAKGDTGFSKGDWNQGDFYYTQCRDTVNSALASVSNVSLDYVLMILGESDADLSNPNFGDDLAAMRTAMISDINGMTDDTTWIVVEISGSQIPANVAIINADLATFASSIPNGHVISNLGLVMTDTYHYDMSSQRLIGQRIAEAING